MLRTTELTLKELLEDSVGKTGMNVLGWSEHTRLIVTTDLLNHTVLIEKRVPQCVECGEYRQELLQGRDYAGMLCIDCSNKRAPPPKNKK